MTAPQTREKPVRTPRDMALSLIVLVIPVLVIVGLFKFFHENDAVGRIDPEPALASATRDGLTLLPRATPPDGWIIISAQYRDGTLRIGYLDPDQRGAQLVQSRSALADTELPKADETRLYGTRDGVTLVLLGQGADLAALAGISPIPVSATG